MHYLWVGRPELLEFCRCDPWVGRLELLEFCGCDMHYPWVGRLELLEFCGCDPWVGRLELLEFCGCDMHYPWDCRSGLAGVTRLSLGSSECDRIVARVQWLYPQKGLECDGYVARYAAGCDRCTLLRCITRVWRG
eukprot:6483383-Pyramimonas_sp.AAC.2